MSSKLKKYVEEYLAKKEAEKKVEAPPAKEVTTIPKAEIALPEIPILGRVQVALKGVRIHIDEVIIRRLEEKKE